MLAALFCSAPTKNLASPLLTRATGVERSAFLLPNFVDAAATFAVEVEAIAEGAEVESARLARGEIRAMREAIFDETVEGIRRIGIQGGY